MADAATQAQPVTTARPARPTKKSSFEEFGQLLRFSLASLRDIPAATRYFSEVLR